MSLLLLQAVMYYVQSREEMFETMRMWILVTNLSSLVWFVLIQYYRLKDSGRACSGDFVAGGETGFANPLGEQSSEQSKVLATQGHFLLVDQGFWFVVFIVMQYVLYIICKIVAIVITNRLEAEYDEQKAQLGGMNF